jgi:signal transduction histidine kinase
VGRAVKFSNKRAVLAMALTGLAVVVPCLAWYLVGSRELERQMAEVADASQEEAQETVRRVASQLTHRLRALLQAEAERPFYQYQPYYHDPNGASEGASVVPSPLASGPVDPLVESYFQADSATGRLSSPATEFQQSQTTKLVRAADPMVRESQLASGLAPILASARGECQAQPVVSQKQAQAVGQRVEVLDNAAYQQNVGATELYANIKTRTPNQPQITLPAANASGRVEIFVGPMKWRTVNIAGDASLVALREVCTPRGSVVQGFLISPKGIANFLKTARLPAKFLPGHPQHEYQSAVNISDDSWRVAIDVTAAAIFAHQQAADLRRTFFTVFIGGVATAVLSGLGVVWIVWQTERLARQRSQFAASAAHELRTPLAGLRIYSEMLADGLGDPGKTKDYAHRIATEAARLGRVVANVLSFTQLERGLLKSQPSTGDLAGVVRESVTRQQPAIEAAGAQLETQIADHLPAVRFDHDSVAQIIQNLLDNAEKHTRQAADRTLCVLLSRDNGAVKLTVRDHGPGVPDELRRRLFVAFVRGSADDAPAGLGLGLMLVKALAEEQGARVSYAEAEGGGAEFTVSFPV